MISMPIPLPHPLLFIKLINPLINPLNIFHLYSSKFKIKVFKEFIGRTPIHTIWSLGRTPSPLSTVLQTIRNVSTIQNRKTIIEITDFHTGFHKYLRYIMNFYRVRIPSYNNACTGSSCTCITPPRGVEYLSILYYSKSVRPSVCLFVCSTFSRKLQTRSFPNFARLFNT